MAAPLTDQSIRSLPAPPPKKQKDYPDGLNSSPPGFGIRVSYTGTKSFYLKYDSHGRRNQRLTFGKYPAVSLAKARELAKKAFNEILAGKNPQAQKLESRRAGDFQSLWKTFYEDQRHRLKPTTLKEWKRIVEKDIIPVFGRIPPSEISRADIKANLKTISQRGGYIANRTLEVIRRIYSWAVEEEIVESSPCLGLKKLHKEKSHERVLTTDEIRKILGALEQERVVIATAFRLWLFTGMRRSELLRTKWEHIDWDKNLLTLPNAKNNKDYLLPLSTQVQEQLKNIHGTTGHSEWVFLGPRKKPINNPQKAKERVEKNSGVKFRINDFRHTVATGLAQLGTSGEIVSAVMNHTSGPAVTRVTSDN